MSKKLAENKKRTGAKKVSSIDPLIEQYDLIRKDVLKLGEDLSKGYDLAKSKLEKSGLIGQLLKSQRLKSRIK
jgi:hypothetical protein